MEISVSEQLYVFLAMTLCGACAGAVFDIFRIIRKIFGASLLTTSIEDILFWLGISAGMFFSLLYISAGEIRWHESIGVILGGIIYFLAISKIFIKILTFILQFLIKFFLLIFKIFLTPLGFLYKMIKKPLCRAYAYSHHKIRSFLGLFSSIKNSFKKLKLIMRKS